VNTKAISPVIATVIIVSVAIAIAVAVAFWMTGITGLFTRYEKLEVVNAYAVKVNDNFNVTVYVRNTGSSDATVDIIFINGKPPTEANVISINASGYNEIFDNVNESFTEVTITTGESVTFAILLDGEHYSSGQIVEIKFHTVAGNEYPRSVQLP